MLIELKEGIINPAFIQCIERGIGGSGTTGIACQRLKRKFVGIELDKDMSKIVQR